MTLSFRSFASSALILTLMLGLAGCSDDDKEEVSDAATGVVEKVKSVVKKSKGLKNDLLSFVPADTAIFAGTGEPTSEEEFLAFFNTGMFGMFQAETKVPQERPENPAGLMLFGLYERYTKFFTTDPTSFSATTGFDKDWNAALYTVEAAPVLRVALEESATFEKFVQSVETEHGVTPTTANIDDMLVRQYSFDDIATGTESLNLVIANSGDYAVVTLFPQTLGEEELKSLIGINAPPSSVIDSGVLRNLVAKQGFSPGWIGFIDHQKIFNYVSATESSAFIDGFKALDSSFKKDAEDNPFTDPVCRQEFGAIFARWPRSVFGYTKWETKSDPMVVDGIFRVETTNTELLDQLKTVQGKLHLPKTLIDSDPAVVMGLGVDIDALLPFIRWLGQALEANGWQCEPLRQYADSFSGVSGPALGMAGVMLAGIKGATLAVLDVKPSSNPDQPVEVLDAMVAVNTSNPGALVTMLMSTPFLGGAQLSTDGTPTPIQLPFPEVSNLQPMLVVKDSAVALFAGERAGAIADSLDASEPVSGFISMQMDYGKQAELMAEAMQAQKSAELTAEQVKAIESLKDLKANVGFSFDIGDGAIEFGTQMQMPK